MTTRRTRHDAPPPELLRAADVAALCSLSVRTVYRLAAARKFPRPIRMGSRTARWPRSDVLNYLANLGAMPR